MPPPVVVALWGLESDYGAYKGGIYNIIRSVATLAYDCRRSEFFRDQLMGAVRIVERGDLQAGGDDRQLGRRARADAVHAGATISSTASISTATAASTWSTACRTRSPPPPI